MSANAPKRPTNAECVSDASFMFGVEVQGGRRPGQGASKPTKTPTSTPAQILQKTSLVAGMRAARCEGRGAPGASGQGVPNHAASVSGPVAGVERHCPYLHVP